MSQPFVPREMTRQDIRRAYALVEAVRSDITLETWLNHIEAILDRAAKAGAVVLTAGDAYLYGAFTYRPWTTLALGQTLMVDDFCAVGMAGDRSPGKALLDAAERMAVGLGCQSVCVKFLAADHEEQTWHTHAHSSAYFSIPALAKRVE